MIPLILCPGCSEDDDPAIHYGAPPEPYFGYCEWEDMRGWLVDACATRRWGGDFFYNQDFQRYNTWYEMP